MIVFDKLWKLMEQKGISTYKLREECGIDCKVEDIMEYRKEPGQTP